MAFGLFQPGFSIWRPATVIDGNGHSAQTFVDTGQAVVGRLSMVSAGSQRDLAGLETGRANYTFSCAASVDIRPEDHVRKADRVVTVLVVHETSNGRRKEASCFVDQSGAA